ncbi:MAG: AI-2E family transporter, partial [Comamonadaceae bacterium]
MPVDRQGLTVALLTLLAALGVLAMLRWASGFFIPLMLGLVFSYALSPVVDWFQRMKIPRAASAGSSCAGTSRPPAT